MQLPQVRIDTVVDTLRVVDTVTLTRTEVIRDTVRLGIESGPPAATDWIGAAAAMVAAFASVAAWIVAKRVARFARSSQDLYELERNRNTAVLGRFVASLARMERHFEAMAGALERSAEQDPQVTGLGTDALRSVLAMLVPTGKEIDRLLDEAPAFPMVVAAHIDFARLQLMSVDATATAITENRTDPRNHARRRDEVIRLLQTVSRAFLRAHDALPQEYRSWGADDRDYNSVLDDVLAANQPEHQGPTAR